VDQKLCLLSLLIQRQKEQQLLLLLLRWLLQEEKVVKSNLECFKSGGGDVCANCCYHKEIELTSAAATAVFIIGGRRHVGFFKFCGDKRKV
jgi:hypothetical protein